MSTIRSVALLTNTLIEPKAPARTIAAFAVTVPVGALRVATVGMDCPLPQAVRYPSGPFGAAAKFREYACAEAGMLHAVAERRGRVRISPPASDGPPSNPVAVRVSTTRQGVSG